MLGILHGRPLDHLGHFFLYHSKTLKHTNMFVRFWKCGLWLYFKPFDISSTSRDLEDVKNLRNVHLKTDLSFYETILICFALENLLHICDISQWRFWADWAQWHQQRLCILPRFPTHQASRQTFHPLHHLIIHTMPLSQNCIPPKLFAHLIQKHFHHKNTCLPIVYPR